MCPRHARCWLALLRGCVRARGDFDEAPAAYPAGQTLFLLLKCGGRCIHQAEHLIHRLAGLGIAVGEPALAVVRASVLVPAPITVFARILAQVFGHPQSPLVGPVPALVRPAVHGNSIAR